MFHEHVEPKVELFPMKPLIKWSKMTIETGDAVEKYNGKTFGLRNFRNMGDAFCINANACYSDQIVVALSNGAGDFLRCSLKEFIANVA